MGRSIWKSPAGRELFRNKAPDTLYLPTPIVTCWGTWLDAVVYCAENLEIFCSVMNEFDRDDVFSFVILQDILKGSDELMMLKTDLAHIHANFSFLSQSVTKAGKAKNLLSETIK
jgi:hypothetical protein